MEADHDTTVGFQVDKMGALGDQVEAVAEKMGPRPVEGEQRVRVAMAVTQEAVMVRLGLAAVEEGKEQQGMMVQTIPGVLAATDRNLI